MRGPASEIRPAACSGLMKPGVPIAVPATVEGVLLVETGGSVTPVGCGIHIDGSRLGQSPVDHQRLAILVQDDVAWFQVAVEDSATVRVSHRVTHIDEPAEEPAQLQRAIAGGRVCRPRLRGTRRSHP